MRLAWFSPMPPVPSGVAACSADLVAALGGDHEIDVYVDEPVAAPANAAGHGVVRSAHDFVWRHRLRPYDLTVYQLGNSSHHDYQWPYLFRYPGLAVLHDAHLHHARAACLLRTKRPDDYRAEFAANHPGSAPALAELAIAGFDNHLYYNWPMTRLVVEASRLAAVHTPAMAAALNDELPDAGVETIRLAHGEHVTDEAARAARLRVRTAHRIAPDAMLFGVFGGLTPEKRVPQILDALAAIVPSVPAAHLLLAGEPARHYDVAADVRRRGLDARVTITGYLTTDAQLTECIAACDVSINLRWPTAREMSGPWLRALAAGRPTVTIDLVHLADVPSLDPRTWRVTPGSGSVTASGSGIRDPGSDRTSRLGVRGSRVATGDLPDPASRIPHPDAVTDRGSGLGVRGSDAGRDSSGRIPGPGSRVPAGDGVTGEAVTVAVDIMDEDHSLRLALRRLGSDADLRASLGAAAARYWDREHSMPRMLEDYRRVLAAAARSAATRSAATRSAAARPAPHAALPPHLVTDGDRRLRRLLGQVGLDRNLLFESRGFRPQAEDDTAWGTL